MARVCVCLLEAVWCVCVMLDDDGGGGGGVAIVERKGGV